jgi:hypothetical protein
MEGEDGENEKLYPSPKVSAPSLDPNRDRYLARFSAALGASLVALDSVDRRRLELYYVLGKKLAEIGRLLGEHESSVSRHLERTRRELRASVEEHLRGVPPLDEAEIALCFQYAAEDVPIDFRQLFPEKKSGSAGRGRKETS